MRRAPRGMTIVEVLVALFILNVALVGFMLTLRALPLTRVTEHQDIALSIASSELDALRVDGYDDLHAGGFTMSSLSLIPQGQGNITIANMGDTLKRVTATVTWREPDMTSNRSISLITFMAQTGGL